MLGDQGPLGGRQKRFGGNAGRARGKSNLFSSAIYDCRFETARWRRPPWTKRGPGLGQKRTAPINREPIELASHFRSHEEKLIRKLIAKSRRMIAYDGQFLREILLAVCGLANYSRSEDFNKPQRNCQKTRELSVLSRRVGEDGLNSIRRESRLGRGRVG